MKLKLDAELLNIERNIDRQYTRCLNYLKRREYNLDKFYNFSDIVKLYVSSDREYKDIDRCRRLAQFEADLYLGIKGDLEFLLNKYIRLLIDREHLLKTIKFENELLELEYIINLYKEDLLTDDEFVAMKKKLIEGK